jgi:hypothetical protein
MSKTGQHPQTPSNVIDFNKQNGGVINILETDDPMGILS